MGKGHRVRNTGTRLYRMVHEATQYRGFHLESRMRQKAPVRFGKGQLETCRKVTRWLPTSLMWGRAPFALSSGSKVWLILTLSEPTCFDGSSHSGHQYRGETIILLLKQSSWRQLTYWSYPFSRAMGDVSNCRCRHKRRHESQRSLRASSYQAPEL
jgi:hypothetical protein